MPIASKDKEDSFNNEWLLVVPSTPVLGTLYLGVGSGSGVGDGVAVIVKFWFISLYPSTPIVIVCVPAAMY